MRRPTIGPRIVRGLFLIWKKTHANLEHGFVPWDWTARDYKDAQRALRYMGLLVDWCQEKEKGGEDATEEEAEEELAGAPS